MGVVIYGLVEYFFDGQVGDGAVLIDGSPVLRHLPVVRWQGFQRSVRMGRQKDALALAGVSLPIENEGGSVPPSSFEVLVEEFGEPADLDGDEFVADIYDVKSAFLNG